MKGKILLLPLAAQAGGHHVQVFGVAEAHDEHARARRAPGGARPAARARNARRPRPRAGGRKMPSRLSIHVSAKAAAPALAPGRGPHGRRQTGPRACAGLCRRGRLAASAPSGSNRRCTTPPQHRPARGPGQTAPAPARQARPPGGGGVGMAWCSRCRRQWCQSRGRPAPPSRRRVPLGPSLG